MHKLPEHLGALALLIGLYLMIRIALWHQFTRHLPKKTDERGEYE
jgi:hypothetical protein